MARWRRNAAATERPHLLRAQIALRVAPAVWQNLPTFGEPFGARGAGAPKNGSFAPLARSLIISRHDPRWTRGQQKGRIQVTNSSIKRTLIAITAAFAMSTLAVGAAVGPAQAAGTAQIA